jgi:hypothetical protein
MLKVAAMLKALSLLSLAATAHGKGLTDEPLISGVHQSLTGADAAGNWTASSAAAGLSVAATVPGDLITDLERAGKIGDPLHERNFKSVLWDETNWTYATQFETSPDLVDTISTSGHAYLVLDGSHLQHFAGPVWQIFRAFCPFLAAFPSVADEKVCANGAQASRWARGCF